MLIMKTTLAVPTRFLGSRLAHGWLACGVRRGAMLALAGTAMMAAASGCGGGRSTVVRTQPEVVQRPVPEGFEDTIGALASANRYRPDWVRTVNIKVALKRMDDRVYPNFSASADLILDEAEGVIVPRECVSRDGAVEGRVRIWSGQQMRTAEVGLGLASATEVEVTSGLDGDERLVCGYSDAAETRAAGRQSGARSSRAGLGRRLILAADERG